MDRPSGPLGAATLSSRPTADTGASRSTTRRAPPVRHATSNSSLSTQSSVKSYQSFITDQAVIELTEKYLIEARENHEEQTSEAAAAEGVTVPGVTIDLSHKKICSIPDEFVDLTKKDLERLALSHNFLNSLPLRFSELSTLRYLNLRGNKLREFPICITLLSALEILDVGRNGIRSIPAEILKLTQLKVFSVQRNSLEALPDCIAEMIALLVLKLDENPLRYPPKELIFQHVASQTDPSGQGEPDDIVVTNRVKEFLRDRVPSNRSATESGEEASSEGAETPRPSKRNASGRFPIKVNGTEVPGSPAFAPRPPPIPSRSHYRGLSQQNAALRRPGVMPLTIGGINERGRSNSDAYLNPKDRAAEKARRMGIVSRKTSELGTVDEVKANNRYSHYRGLSHGSAMQSGSKNNVLSPASPADAVLQRATYVKRLSSLPERKQESLSSDAVVEAAKSILYALVQVHPLINNLLDLTRDPVNKRTSLEEVVYNTTTHVEELERHIQDYDTYTEEEEELSPRSNAHVHRTCVTCVSAYIHVCGLLQRNAQALLTNGDPRYIRTLLLNVFGSIAEIRNASVAFVKAREDSNGLRSSQYTTADKNGVNENNKNMQESSNGRRRSRSFAVGSNGTGRMLSDDDHSRDPNGLWKKDNARLTDDDEEIQGKSTSQFAGTQSMRKDVVPTTRLRKPTLKSIPRSLASTSEDMTGGRTPTMELISRSRRPPAMGPPRSARDRSVTPTYDRSQNYDSYYGSELVDENYANMGNGQPPIDLTHQLRSALAPLASVTPRSGTFVASPLSTDLTGRDFLDEDAQFERIYQDLRNNVKVAELVLPSAKQQFARVSKLMRPLHQNQKVREPTWAVLLSTCDTAMAHATSLKSRLSTIQLEDPAARTTRSFWQLIDDFLTNATAIMLQANNFKKAGYTFEPELMIQLLTLRDSLKITSHDIESSPWREMASKKTSHPPNIITSLVPLPMTPQSAALGPAAQATVPSTPQSAYFNGPGASRYPGTTSMSGSVSNSRSGTMTASREGPSPQYYDQPLGVMDPTSPPYSIIPSDAPSNPRRHNYPTQFQAVEGYSINRNI